MNHEVLFNVLVIGGALAFFGFITVVGGILNSHIAEGYQDETGFHAGPEPIVECRCCGTQCPRSEAVEVSDGHWCHSCDKDVPF